jgi:membrane dipeptidase
MIEVVGERGGVMGANFLPYFILPREELAAGKKATVGSLVDHIDRMAELVGTDHIGLGSDFDGITSTPVGLEDASKMHNVTLELCRREYSDDDVKKILGGNFLRVIKKVVG